MSPLRNALLRAPLRALLRALPTPSGRLALASTLVLTALACSGDEAQPMAELDGATLYQSQCSSCHGKDGLGFMGLGASFEGVRDYWDEEKLVMYMGDPQAFAAKDPRLGKRDMAAISDDVPLAARLRIARHTLELMDAAR